MVSFSPTHVAVCLRLVGSLLFHTEVLMDWTDPITLFPLVPLVAKVSICKKAEVMGEG